MIEKVESSVIDAVEYLHEKKELFVRFTSGKVYRYTEIDNGTYRDFMSSESKGVFYNASIKSRYPAMAVVGFPEVTQAEASQQMVVERNHFIKALAAQIEGWGGQPITEYKLEEMSLFAAWNFLWPLGIQLSTEIVRQKKESGQ